MYTAHPDHLSIKELARYGDDHQDPYVRKLAYYAEMLSYFVPSEYRNDPDEWFDANEYELREVSSHLQCAEEDLAEAQARAETAEEQYKALLFDLDRDELYYQNNSLKTRIAEQRNRIAKQDSKIQQLEAEHNKLKDAHKYLTEVHNTWTVISKPLPEVES